MLTIKNKFALVLCSVFVQLIFAQNQPRSATARYLKIQNYKTIFKLKSINLDSVDHRFYKGDTLIKYDPKPDPNKVLVPFDFRDSSFLDYYVPIAFRLSHDTKDSLKQTMKYWRNDIKIYFSKNITRGVKKEFESFTQFINRNVDSLNIEIVKKIERSNFIVYTSDDYNYESQLKENRNSGYYIYWNRDNQIYKGAIKLNNDEVFNDQLKIAQLKVRFLQSLGHFTFDKRLDCKHYFSNCYSPNKEFTKLDLELLQYHYSYGICKGISLESFKSFHEESNKIKDRGQKIFITHLKSNLRKNN